MARKVQDGYPAWSSIARLNRDVVVSEKIDGTNGLISIQSPEIWPPDTSDPTNLSVFLLGDEGPLLVRAGSRTKWLAPGKQTDNYGFAGWVKDNAQALVATLGEGNHYGEWFGSGIQKHNYGLVNGDKRFALFNTHRWDHETVSAAVPQLTVVPVLDQGLFSHEDIQDIVIGLRIFGSEWAKRHVYNGHTPATGLPVAEGVVVYHTAAKTYFKVTCLDDAMSKQEAERRALAGV